MKLFYTPTSPYARIARVAVFEMGLADAVEMEPVAVRDPRSPLLAYNPTGKVPTLVTREGRVLSETRLVCEYLDTLHGGPRLTSQVGDLATRQLEGLVGGFMEGILAWVREARRPPAERSAEGIALEKARAGRCLDALEAHAKDWDAAPSFARIALACALGSADFRLPLRWREGRPRLAAWYAEFSSRPSLRGTAPVEPGRAPGAG